METDPRMSTADGVEGMEKRVRKPKMHYSPEGYVCERFENDPGSFNGKIPAHGGSRAHSHAYSKEYRLLDGRPKKYQGLEEEHGVYMGGDRASSSSSSPIKHGRGRPIGSGKKSSGVQNSVQEKSHGMARKRGRPRRTNKAIDMGVQSNNKWETYRKEAMKFIRMISKANYVVDVYQQDRGHQDMGFAHDEINRHIQKIQSYKRALKDLVKKLVNENMDHTQYEQLQQEDDDGMIDINEINCSVCHLDAESEENDIVLCDRVGCNRAYHLLCLDPPIQSLSKSGFEDNDDWFCWRCEVLDFVLDHINDEFNTDYNEHNLFPELQTGYIDMNSIGEESDDEGEDKDYDPAEGSIHSNQSGEDSSIHGGDEGSDSNTDCSSEESAISLGELSSLVAEGGDDAYFGNKNDDNGYYTRKNCTKMEQTERSKLVVIEDFDEANVLPEGSRRERNKVDYIKLSRLMFGDTADSDIGDDDENTKGQKQKRKYNSQGRVDKISVVDHSLGSESIAVKRKRGRPRKDDSLLQIERSPNSCAETHENRNEFKHRLLSRFSIPASELMSPEDILWKVKAFMESMGVVNIRDFCNSEGIEHEVFMTYIAGVSLGDYDQHMSKEQIIFFKDVAIATKQRLDRLLENTVA